MRTLKGEFAIEQEKGEIDPDLIAPSAPDSQIKTDIVFQTELEDKTNPQGAIPEKVSVSDGPLGAQIAGELPKTDLKFELVGIDNTKLATLQEIEEQILGTQSISQETARLIEEKVGGFLSTEAAIHRFTKQPSRVSLESSKAFLRQAIEEQSQQFYKAFSFAIDQYFKSSYAGLQTFLDTGHEELVSSFEEFYNSLFPVIESIEASANLVIPGKEGEFINLYHTGLSAVCDEQVQSDDYHDCLEGARSIKALLNKQSLCDFIALVNSETFEPSGYLLPNRVESSAVLSMSIQQLANLIMDGQVRLRMSTLFEYIKTTYLPSQESTIAKLADLNNQDAVSISSWFLDHKQSITQLLENVHRVYALTALIPAGLIAVQSTLVAFKTKA